MTMKSLLLIAVLVVPADCQQAMLTLSGASCVEELSSDEVLRYQALSEHPLDLNLAGESRLRSSGLFSPFQLASLLEYRRESGDILSFAELGLIDGFSRSFAEALSYFVSLRSSSPPGHRRRLDFHNTLTLKASGRQTGELAYGLRYEASLGERAELRWTSRTTYSEPEPGIGTVSAAYYGRGALGKVVVGNYGARFGQGLVMWSGFVMSGYGSAESFCRKACGLSVTGAAGAEFLGVASDWRIGGNRLSAAVSVDGAGTVVNLARDWRRVSAGVTAGLEAASADWRVAFTGGSFFGEAACSYRGRPSALAGVQWIPRYGHKLSFLARWYDLRTRLYSGVAAGYDSPSLLLSADSGYRRDKGFWQHKFMCVLRPAFTCGELSLAPSLRVSGRLRPSDKSPFRCELRPEVKGRLGGWILECRCDALWCKGFAWLSCIDAGFDGERFDARLRGGVFKIDNWDDRIYVYEYDAPGNFNVPAYYGRGWNASLYLGWHISKAHSLWLRASMISYPWNSEPEDGRNELKLQYRLSL